MKRVCIFLTILLLVGVLCSCNEDEPLPEGVSSQPDVPAESFVNSETGEMEWPAELLPEGFPVADYDKIYSAERTDNAVVILLFGVNSPFKKTNAKMFAMKLVQAGFLPYDDMETKERTYISRDGYKVMLADSDSDVGNGYHLATVNKESPTGYTFEIRVIPADTSSYECMFWEFPAASTDLGLEPKVFDEWPAEFLPEGFENPGEKIEILQMEQKNNGLFITLKGSLTDLGDYETKALKTAGYLYSVDNVWINPNGDYIFYSEDMDFHANDDEIIVTAKFQFCPANDGIKK